MVYIIYVLAIDFILLSGVLFMFYVIGENESLVYLFSNIFHAIFNCIFNNG